MTATLQKAMTDTIPYLEGISITTAFLKARATVREKREAVQRAAIENTA